MPPVDGVVPSSLRAHARRRWLVVLVMLVLRLGRSTAGTPWGERVDARREEPGLRIWCRHASERNTGKADLLFGNPMGCWSLHFGLCCPNGLRQAEVPSGARDDGNGARQLCEASAAMNTKGATRSEEAKRNMYGSKHVEQTTGARATTKTCTSLSAWPTWSSGGASL